MVHFGDVLPSQSLGRVLKKQNLTQQKHTYIYGNPKKLNLTKKHLLSLFMCVQYVHNCCTQHSTEQTLLPSRQSSLLRWLHKILHRTDQFSFLPCRRSSLLRWCLFEGRGNHAITLQTVLLQNCIIFFSYKWQTINILLLISKLKGTGGGRGMGGTSDCTVEYK